MSTPTFPTVTPTPSTHDFGKDNEQAAYGPDYTKTKDTPPPTASTTDTKRKPGPFSSLGQNKKPRSAVRKLDVKDKELLYAWYMRIAAMTMPFHPKLSQALQMQAEDCVNTWCELAENNDGVRRKILAFIEGGAWGKVFMAHAPIFLAVIPENLIEKIMNGSMLAAMFQHEPEEPEPQEQPQYPADLNPVPPFERRENPRQAG